MRHVNYISLTTIKEASKLFVYSYSARNYSFVTFFRSPYNHFYKAFDDFAGLNPGFKRNNGNFVGRNNDFRWNNRFVHRNK